jgi:uncharacterized membrane protein
MEKKCKTQREGDSTMAIQQPTREHGQTQTERKHGEGGVRVRGRGPLLLGGAATIGGILLGGPVGALVALVGGNLIYKNATGKSLLPTPSLPGVGGKDERSGKGVSVPHEQGIRAERVITIMRSPEELYTFWRNFENLPRFMHHLESVTVQDNTHSHWVAKAPAGMTVEWDAEIINEVQNEVIGWRSLEGAQVANAGAVRFSPAPGGRGTEVSVKMEYTPPGGAIGAAFAKLFGEEPNQQLADDLRRFKQMMEVGEVVTTEGQPSGRK